MKKRLLASFLAMCLVLTLLPAAALADEGSQVERSELTEATKDSGGDTLDTAADEPDGPEAVDDMVETADSIKLTDVGETGSDEGETKETSKTLTEIFAEASNGDILTLEQDVTVNGEEDADYKNSGTVTLNLNEHTITGENDNIALRANAGNGTLKLTNGKIVAGQGTFCTVSAGNSTLELSDMELENVTAYGCSIKAFNGGTINLHEVNSKSTTGGGVTAAGGTVNVYNSTFTQEGYYDHNSVNLSASDGTGTVNVYSGTFTSKNYGLYIFSSGGTINVYDGTFDADKAVLKVDLDLENYPYAEAYVNISGGTFDGELEIADKEGVHVQITGGTFTNTGLTEKEFSAYVPESALLTEGADGVFTVAELDETNSVARVGDTSYYSSLSAAIAAAEDGDTVTLLKNVETSSRIQIENNITLDLNEHTLTSTADIACLVIPNKSFELTGGTLDHKPGSGSTKSGVFTFAGATFTLASDATIKSTGAGVMGTNNKSDEGKATFNIYGTIDCGDIGIWGQGPDNTYNIIGATINSNYFGVYQNGSYGGCSVTIQDSTITDDLTDGCGVYISNSKKNANDKTQGMQTLVIENSSITGATAVEVKYTNVTIEGKNTVLTATGDPSTLTPNGNGSVTTGYALAITHNGTSDTVDSAAGDILVENGTFNGLVEVQDPSGSATTEAEVAISGGMFSSEVNGEYCAPGFEPVTIDGKYTVQLKTQQNFVAQIQNENGQIVAAYEELDGAVGAVKSGQTIVLLENVTGALPVPKVADVTYTAAEGVTVSGGMDGTVVGNLTLDGITFTEKDVYLRGQENATVTVKDCTFSNVTAHGNKLGAFNMVTAGNLVFTGNRITGTQNAEGSTEAVGIYTQNLTDVTISGNIIGAVSGTSINVNGNKGTTTITGNELTDWASAGGNTPGRAIRLSDSGSSNITITGNKLVNSRETLESYIKISGVEENTVDATRNYWNGKSPDSRAGDGNPLFEVADTIVNEDKITSEPYFEETTMRDPEDLSDYVPPVTPDDDNNNSSSSSSSTSVRRYNIEADAGRGGDISPDGRVRVRRGENQTFRITADDGWEIADVEVDGESVGAVERYTFENVRTDHTISATFRQIDAEPETPALPFTDVAEGDWYYDAVAYCWENGIMDGTSGTVFAPNMILTRAMMAQVLYNLAGGTASTVAGFPDVAASAWYADAVNWAAANGYVTGYDNGSYGPEDNLTREQMAAILYRYAGSPAPAGSLDGFADAASASAYAVDALRWAVGEGLLTGKDGGRLDPTGTASRAELAQILARFAQR